MYRLLIILLFITSTHSFSVTKLPQDMTLFSGRISRMNKGANLIRIKIKFENAKFLSRNNRIEIWNESQPERKCLAYLEGRTSEYLLIRIPKYNICVKKTDFTVGSYIHMYSPDLENNLVTAKELVNVLHRKRTALTARLSRHERETASYIEKMDVVNKRYDVLRQKLELEWQKELADLEEDKLRSYEGYKSTQTRLHELEYKLQQYRVRDQNMVEDRWSLDPKQYYKK